MIKNIFKYLYHLNEMGKRGAIVLLFLSLILSTAVVYGVNSTNATNSSTNYGSSNTVGTNTATNADVIDKAYQCLRGQIGGKSSLSLQEAVFSALALGNEKKATDLIVNEKNSREECWPKAGCKIKDTAQVLLAYDRLNKNTADVEKWLLGKNGTASDLNWYLELDIQNHKPTECTIRYDNTDRKINVNNDMKLSSGAGSCLTLTTAGYWLKISSSCLDKTFEVTCNEDFISTLLYEKATGGTIYVSTETHSAASLGRTKEKVNAQCFKGGTNCDYEGSLWSALALHKTGHDVSSFVPYLTSAAEDNQRFLPSAFLYIMAGGEDEYSNLIQSQKEGKYWQQTGTPYSRYYDTSLAMLSLYGGGSAEIDNARNYLLGIQGKDGCWNSDNIRDTAFIVYSGWPRSGSSGSGGSGGNSTGGGANLCTSASAGYSCGTATACSDSGGSVLYDYECSGFAQFCCNVKIQEKLCSELNGHVCASGQTCNGNSAPSADGSCCLGTCSVATAQDSCTTIGNGFCRSACFADEEESKGYTCTESAQICCTASTATPITVGSSKWIWILILGILILLVIFAIIYRTKIQIWWHSRKGGTSVRPITRGGPGAFTPPFMRPTPRFGAPAFGRTAPRQPMQTQRPRGGDSEFEETMKKLRDMGK